ncbi:ABC transporter substrate-binding protein [candidate division KSB1 bacterium]
MILNRYKWVLIGSACLLPVGGALGADKVEPYRMLRQEGAGFHGRVQETVDPRSLDSIRIGLLLPPVGPGAEAVRAGVAKAVAEANDRGGYQGVPFETVFRSDNGPWGIAAKQIAAFRYEDNVWAILGGLDGHKTHLAELVAAKTWIPVVSPTATDLSIDYANVPWVFRLAPDDVRRAAVILDQAGRNGWRSLIIFRQGDRESRTGVDRLLEEANRRRQPPARVIEYEPQGMEGIADLFDGLPDGSFDAAVVWGQPAGTIAMMERIRRYSRDIPILIPAAETLVGLGKASFEPGIIIAAALPEPLRRSEEYRRFRAEIELTNGPVFHPWAAFGYDAARMVIHAIETGGLNRPRIRERLADIKFHGLSGIISFDSLGGSTLTPTPVRWDNGRWVEVGSNGTLTGVIPPRSTNGRHH